MGPSTPPLEEIAALECYTPTRAGGPAPLCALLFSLLPVLVVCGPRFIVLCFVSPARPPVAGRLVILPLQ